MDDQNQPGGLGLRREASSLGYDVNGASYQIDDIPVVEYEQHPTRTISNLATVAKETVFSASFLAPFLVFCVLLGGLSLLVLWIMHDNAKYAQSQQSTNVSLDAIGYKARSALPQDQAIAIAGNLSVDGDFILNPVVQPTNPKFGSIYIDKTTRQIYYFNGKTYQPLISDDTKYAQLQATGSIAPQNGSLSLSGTVSAANFIGSGVGLTGINASSVSSGVLNGGVLPGGGAVRVLAGNGLSGGGSVALGGSTTLNTIFGSSANTSVQGDTKITCTSSVGNLFGGGNEITLGNGGTCDPITITDSPTFTGTLSVTGYADLADVTIADSLTSYGSTLLAAATTYPNYPSGGFIGPAATTVDTSTSFVITQTTPGQVLSLPAPTNTSAGRIVFVMNIGSTSFDMYGVSLAPNTSQGYIYTSMNWSPFNVDALGGSSSGVTSVGAIDSQVKSVNGLVISGTTIYAQTADTTTLGMVSTSAQSFAGAKTFTGDVILSASNLNIGDNNIVTNLSTINSTELDLLDGKNSSLIDTNDAVTTAITGVGTINSGAWQGSAITDTYVANDLTIAATGSVDWSALTNYPAACSAGQAITSLGDVPSCGTFASASGSGNYIQNTTGLQTGANMYIESAGTSSVTAKYRVLAGQTADVLQVRNSADDTTLFAVSPTGAVTIGTWQATAITDTYVANDLTISNLGTVDWLALTNYPAACGAGQALTSLGDTVTCGTFAAGSGTGNYIQNTTVLQTGANSYIESAAIGSVTVKYRVLAGQTADILQVRNSADDTTVFAVSPTGNVTAGTYNTASISGGTLTTTSVNGVTTASIILSSSSYADPVWVTSLAKSKVGLGSVENIALSTWSGSSNIVTLGTVAAGSWQANTIANQYIADDLTINTSGTVDWSALNNYPAACGAGQALTGLGDSITCSTFAAGSGNGDYIRNQSLAAQTATDYWISGTGRSDTSLLTPVLDTPTANVLSIGATNASTIRLGQNVEIASGKTVSINGGTTIASPVASTTAFQVQSANNVSLFTVDTAQKRIVIQNDSVASTFGWSVGVAGGTARQSHETIVVGSKLYAWGGVNQAGTRLNTLDIFDFTTNTWSSGAAGGMARTDFSMVTYNNKIYIWGGHNGALMNTMDIYDIATNSWSTGVTGGTARAQHTAVVYGSKMYAWGGCGTSICGSQVNTLDIFDFTTNTWSSGAAGGTARRTHTATVYNGKMYIWGGLGATTAIDIYDFNLNTWSTGTPGGTSRYHHGAITYGNKMYIWGGSAGGTTLEYYNYETNAWGTDTAGSNQRYSMSTVLYGNKMIAWGGCNPTACTTTYNTMDIFAFGSATVPPTVLVLANAASNPTDSVNGSMYFNTASNTYKCYTVTGGWTDCSSNTNGVLQGGNSFGVAMTIGTNDTQTLGLKVNNATVQSFATNGSVLFKNTANSTGALQVQNALGTVTVLSVDTTNSRLGVNMATPYYDVDIGKSAGAVVGNSLGALTLAGGPPISISQAESANLVLNPGTGYYPGGDAVLSGGKMSTFYGVGNAASVRVGGLNYGGSASITLKTGSTGGNVSVVNSGDVAVFSVENSQYGAALFKNSSNVTNSFQVQNSSGAVLLGVDASTSGGSTTINTASASAGATVLNIAQGGTVQGTITVNGATVSYNAFTGSHYATLDPGVTVPEYGKLMTLTGAHGRMNDKGEIIYTVRESQIANDPQAFGSFNGQTDGGNPAKYGNGGLYLVSAAGNGELWITENEAGNIYIGDPLLSSTQAGYAMKDPRTFARSHVIAKAAETLDWSTITTSVNGIKVAKISVLYSLYDQDNIANTLQIQNLRVAKDALLGGSAFIAENLNVSGATTLTDLTVTGNTTIMGDLTVQTIHVADITISGHIATSGGAPVAILGASVGGIDQQTDGSAPMVTVNGNDTMGTVIITAGKGATSGKLVTIRFSKPFSKKPKIVVSAANHDTQKLGIYYDDDAVTVDTFVIESDVAPQPGVTYKITYWTAE